MDEMILTDLYVDLLESTPESEEQKLARKDAFIKSALEFLKRHINEGNTCEALGDIYNILKMVEAVLEELKKAAYPNYKPLPPPVHPTPPPPKLEPKTLPPETAPVTPKSRT